jgi:hypothetical protein
MRSVLKVRGAVSECDAFDREGFYGPALALYRHVADNHGDRNCPTVSLNLGIISVSFLLDPGEDLYGSSLAQVDLGMIVDETLYEINNEAHRWTHEDVDIPTLAPGRLQEWHPNLSMTKSDDLSTYEVDVTERDTEFHMGAGSNITTWLGFGKGTYIPSNEQNIDELEAYEDDDVYEIVQ